MSSIPPAAHRDGRGSGEAKGTAVSTLFEDGADRARYGISVAAGLAGTGVQNLRAYERRGLLSPARTPGGTRLYSDADVAQVRRIGELLASGLNLAGVERVLLLEETVLALQGKLEGLRAHNDALAADNRALRTATSRAREVEGADRTAGSPRGEPANGG
jgi:MerR family transcriptional regulator/heat shock protein HspR